MNRMEKRKATIKWGVIFFLFVIVIFSFREKPVISVVMPVYNRQEELLTAAIKSILSQTYSDFEFVIIDDGSTDKTADIIRSYQKKDSRIRFIQNKKNQGVSFSRQRGNDAARGKYIVVMDSDDKAYPRLLEKLLEFMEKHPDAAVAYPVHDIHTDEHPDLIFHHSLPIYDLVFDNVIQNTGVIFRRDFVEKNNIRYNLSLKSAEDYDFWMKIFYAGGKIYKIYSEPLLLIRLHQTNTPEYYAEMKATATAISHRLMTYFNVPTEYFKNKCLIMKTVFQSPHNFFTVREQKEAFQKYCPDSPNAILVKHPYWEDYFIIDSVQKRVCRYGNQNECADVLSFENNFLIIKWDLWGTETFKMNAKGELELQ